MSFRRWLHVQFSPAQLSQATHDLVKARELILLHGWTSDWYRMQSGWLDIAAAINQAAGNWGGPTFDNPALIAETIMMRHVGMNLYAWNDDYVSGQAHVIATLDGLIAILTEENSHGPADSEDQAREEGAHVGAH